MEVKKKLSTELSSDSTNELAFAFWIRQLILKIPPKYIIAKIGHMEKYTSFLDSECHIHHFSKADAFMIFIL